MNKCGKACDTTTDFHKRDHDQLCCLKVDHKGACCCLTCWRYVQRAGPYRGKQS